MPLRGISTKIFKTMIQKVSLIMGANRGFILDNGEPLESLNPKELFLFATGECAGLTITHLLNEHIVDVTNFTISVEGTLSTPTLVAESRFTSFNIIYRIECRTLKDQIVISRAINLAHEKYCGLVQMARKIAPLTHETSIVTTGETEE